MCNKLKFDEIIDFIKKYICGILFALSFSMLSFQLIIADYEKDIAIITILVSFCCSIYFWNKEYENISKFIKKNKVINAGYVALALIVWVKLYLIKGIELKIKYDYLGAINPFKIRYFSIAIISVIYLGIYLGNRIKDWIVNLYNSLEKWDKKIYLVFSILCFFIILIAYNFNQNWYLQYDKVYSIDSGWCFENIYPKPQYYDIRHPIISIYTFPMFAIVDTFVNILFEGELVKIAEAVILQYINIQILILIGLQIKLLTKNKMTFIMYMLSFPTMLYSLFFEKYQLCVFLLFMYVFTVCSNSNESDEDNSKKFFISAVGSMPTSAFIGILELIRSDKLKNKIIRIAKIIVLSILVFICLGRGHVLKYGFSEMLFKKTTFANDNCSIVEKLISTTKMIQSSFIALPSFADETKYWWNNITESISLLSLFIIGIIIIGYIKNREKLFVKIATIWNLFAFILFVVLNWSVKESPLFSIYFSWSLIPLFVMGLDYIIEKLKLNRTVVYGIIFVLMIVINVTTIFDIQKFLFIL